jgi:hypothetical protein
MFIDNNMYSQRRRFQTPVRAKPLSVCASFVQNLAAVAKILSLQKFHPHGDEAMRKREIQLQKYSQFEILHWDLYLHTLVPICLYRPNSRKAFR